MNERLLTPHEKKVCHHAPKIGWQQPVWHIDELLEAQDAKTRSATLREAAMINDKRWTKMCEAVGFKVEYCTSGHVAREPSVLNGYATRNPCSGHWSDPNGNSIRGRLPQDANTLFTWFIPWLDGYRIGMETSSDRVAVSVHKGTLSKWGASADPIQAAFEAIAQLMGLKED